MSYIYLQGQGEESSVATCSVIEQCVQLKLNPSQRRCCCRGSVMESFLGSLSGMISGRLTEPHGETASTLFAEDSPARILVLQGKAKGFQVKGRGSGRKWRGWSAKLDQSMSLWKIRPCLPDEDLTGSSWIWPAWGMMQDGECWVQMMPVLLTEGKESGSSRMIPTPTCSDTRTANMKSSQTSENTMHSVTLARLVEKEPWKIWPTPTSTDATAGAVLNQNTKLIRLKSGRLRKVSNNGVAGSIGLARTVALWPTPDASMGTRGLEKDWKPVRPSGHHAQYTINQAVNDVETFWPTPTASEDVAGTPEGKMQWMLTQAAKSGCKTRKEYLGGKSTPRNYPTPTTSDRFNVEPQHDKGRKLLRMEAHPEGTENLTAAQANQMNGQLNPDWVEWLMEWPIGWTSLEPLSGEKYQGWVQASINVLKGLRR